jgi:hypothetical protein
LQKDYFKGDEQEMGQEITDWFASHFGKEYQLFPIPLFFFFFFFFDRT